MTISVKANKRLHSQDALLYNYPHYIVSNTFDVAMHADPCG